MIHVSEFTVRNTVETGSKYYNITS